MSTKETIMQPAIPSIERVTFFAGGTPVTTVFSQKTLGRDRLVEHIQAADYDTAVQVRSIEGRRPFANVYSQGGAKRVLAPIAPAPKRKPRRMSERRRWELENGPCVTIRPRES
jgi:hypothetical protein